MELQLLQGDLDFHWLRPADDASWQQRGGVPVVAPWTIPKLELYADDAHGRDFLPVDCLPMNTGCDGPIISAYAREMLNGLFSPAGEFWPVDVLGHEYWWFNCLATVDALDADSSDADWQAIGGDWGEFRWITVARRLSFRTERIADAPAIFRVTEFPQGALFAQEAVEHAISRYKLTGFRLDPVWSALRGGVRDPRGFGFADAFEKQTSAQAAQKRAGARAALNDRRSPSQGSLK